MKTTSVRRPKPSPLARLLAGGCFALLVLAACGSGDDEPASLAGRNCETDGDCGPDGHCLGEPKGICSVPATGPCTNGSTEECPDGARCWKTNGGEYYCWADCNVTCDSNGECDSDGLCGPRQQKGTSCQCSCRCSGCSATSRVTCAQPSTQCGSCSNVCASTCAQSPGCGGFISGSGSCS